MTVALLLTAFGLGLRHGVDWDHIAAIADLNGTAENRRRGFRLSFLYAVGHAIVVFALGTAAIVFGAAIPDGLDRWMGRVVGVTLIALGVWVLVQLARHGRDFRLRSRWMLVLDGTFAGVRRVRGRRGSRRITVEHEHPHLHGTETHDAAHAHDHAHVPHGIESPQPALVGEGPGRPRWVWSQASRSHSHQHRHELALPNTAGARYDSGTATGIGMLHGVGVESPTQIALFVASTSVVGGRGGLALLVAWVVGLVVANSVLAILAGFGMLHAEGNFGIYVAVAVLVAMGSLAMGAMLIAGLDALPTIAA